MWFPCIAMYSFQHKVSDLNKFRAVERIGTVVIDSHHMVVSRHFVSGLAGVEGEVLRVLQSAVGVPSTEEDATEACR